jgi:hypothetical protein
MDTDTLTQSDQSNRSESACVSLRELLKEMSTWNCIWSWESYDEDDHGPTYIKQFWDVAVFLTGDKTSFQYKDDPDDLGEE